MFPEVLEDKDQEDERVMLVLQDHVVDPVVSEPLEKMVFKELLDQLVHQDSEEKTEKQEHLVQPVSLE